MPWWLYLQPWRQLRRRSKEAGASLGSITASYFCAHQGLRTCLWFLYLGSLLGGGVKGTPHYAPLGPLHTSSHKFFIDGLLHKDSRPCRAALALVEEHTLVSLLHSIVHYKRKQPCSQHQSMGLPPSPPQRTRHNVMLTAEQNHEQPSEKHWTENTAFSYF